MIHDIVSAEYRGDYRIEVVFDDGKRGVVDFSAYARRGGVFAHFRDMNFFRNFHINKELGVLAWGEDLDIAPETLYAEATGMPLPEWMTAEDVSIGEGRRSFSRGKKNGRKKTMIRRKARIV